MSDMDACDLWPLHLSAGHHPYFCFILNVGSGTALVICSTAIKTDTGSKAYAHANLYAHMCVCTSIKQTWLRANIGGISDDWHHTIKGCVCSSELRCLLDVMTGHLSPTVRTFAVSFLIVPSQNVVSNVFKSLVQELVGLINILYH